MPISDGAVRVLAALLEARTGQQIAPARRYRIDSVLSPLLARHGLSDLDALVSRIIAGRDPALADAAIEALLNHETFFFRDVGAFRLLEEKGLGRLRAARAAGRQLRIWSAGCSTGQEAYTMAMMIQDRPDLWRGWTVEMLATDLSAPAIARAEAGRYSAFEVKRGLPAEHRLHRFQQLGEAWQADLRLRAAVRFRVHNLLSAPPPGRFDLILCRNVLMYFSPDVRATVFGRLAGALAADGVLMLGAGETVTGQTDAFVPDSECPGLFRSRPAPVPPLPAARLRG